MASPNYINDFGKVFRNYSNTQLDIHRLSRNSESFHDRLYLLPKLSLYLCHIVIERFALNLAIPAHNDGDAGNGERATGSGQTGIIDLMGACRNPLHCQLVAAYDTICHSEFQIWHAGKPAALGVIVASGPKNG